MRAVVVSNVWVWFVLLSIDLLSVCHAVWVGVLSETRVSVRVQMCTVDACTPLVVPA